MVAVRSLSLIVNSPSPAPGNSRELLSSVSTGILKKWILISARDKIDKLASANESKGAKGNSFLLPCPFMGLPLKVWSRLRVDLLTASDPVKKIPRMPAQLPGL